MSNYGFGRQAGVTVVSISPNADAYLYVNVTIACSDSVGCTYNISLEMMQGATLKRNQQYVVAATWSTGGVWYNRSTSAAAQDARRHLADYVDEFLNDYLSVNPVPRKQY